MKEAVKKHCGVAAICLIVAFLTVLFYKFTCKSSVIFGFGTIIKGLIAGVVLFAMVETVRLVTLWLIVPFISRENFIGSYTIILCFSFLISFVGSLVYGYLKNKSFVFSDMIQVLAFGIGLFLLICFEILIIKAVTNSKMKGIKYNIHQLTGAIICVCFVVGSFLPVLNDDLSNRIQKVYETKSFLTPAWIRGEYGSVGEITKDRIISQTFKCNGDSLLSATFTGATYMRDNNGELRIRLIDNETDEILETWLFDVSKFTDNSAFTITVSDPYAHMDMKNRIYRFDFIAEEATIGNAVTVYRSTTDCYKEGALFINGEDTGGDLLVSLKGIFLAGNYNRVRIMLSLCYAVVLQTMLLLAFRGHTDKMGMSKKEY